MAATRALCVRSADELKGIQLQRLADFNGTPVLAPATEVYHMHDVCSELVQPTARSSAAVMRAH
jgi:hypothetical protein